ncbi:uncharacterized protein LOC110611597 [Manihot esculenta]|uniref:uncharacterized protein LOC110611597 n=1 Tax=Manihot esculenta TaxID=3983 RepID=UPI000B5D8D53|nr:uncharacterized protein LOC110611597 [Manihot esculenta]
MGHLKNFVKKEPALRGRSEERREPVRERVARLVNEGSSGTINMIVREETEQPLQANRKRRRGGKLKEVEVMQVAEHILGVVSFSAVDRERVEMPYDDALVVEAIIHNFKVQKILVDDGSKVNLLPYRVFKAMKIANEDMVKD